MFVFWKSLLCLDEDVVVTGKFDYFGGNTEEEGGTKVVLIASPECYSWEFSFLVGTRCREGSSQRWTTCLLSVWPTLLDLWTWHVSVVTTTLTLRQTRLTPEFSVCCSMQGCSSSSVRGEKSCTDFFPPPFFFSRFECLLDSHSSDAMATLQKCAKNLV